MVTTITKLYPPKSVPKDGPAFVTALFYWDGRNRSVRVPDGEHKVGDKIIVSLEEYYKKEEKRTDMWWKYRGGAE